MFLNRKNKTQSKFEFLRYNLCNLSICLVVAILALLLISCSNQYPDTCPSNKQVGLAQANEITSDESLPFRFPLDISPSDEIIPLSWLGRSNECTPDVVGGCYEYNELKFHAAEDYKSLAGTPIYAMADGIIRFSGTAGGYGWLILIDHPQANLYSLYGHLSPSRWKLNAGTVVERGDLIGYVGDSDENGGSKEQPVLTHLHFGVRAGQVADYPARGEWRYMAGWIKLCPQDVGWLQPSLIITNQEIPDGGYPQPEVGFLTQWAFELIFASFFTVSGIIMIHQVSRQKSRFLLLLPGIFIILAGIFLNNNGLIRGYMLPAIGILILVVGIFMFIRRPNSGQNDQ